jgi:radial spoke head protein 4A
MVSKSDRGLLSKEKKFVIPNFDEEAEMLEWAGISFGEEDTFKLSKSIKRLAVMSGADRVRFVGKMYGTKQDYWICSGFMAGADELTVPRTQEARGTGANSLVYWVTDNLLSDWIQLPDCCPEHIVIARMIKHIFVGDLNATIDSNPPFPGKERHFLRAQLSRIFSATAIIPKGLFEIDEETSEMKFAEEFAMPGTEELKSNEVWANLHPIILKAGRTTHIEPEDMPEEEKEEYMAKVAEEDKTEERFRAINEHVNMPGMDTAWSSKICGDIQQYN